MIGPEFELASLSQGQALDIACSRGTSANRRHFGQQREIVAWT
jgi:hypothetical protein